LSGLHTPFGFSTDIDFLRYLGSLSGLHPPSCTGMLIGDTSRQHYSRERTHAGHKSYEGNNTGKQQQNMILESPTNDFREKEENQTSHTGMELNNYFLERTSLQRKPPDTLSKGNRTGAGQKPETMLEIVFIVKTGYMKVEARKYSLDSINFIAM
jgi:hypothetical protein